MNRDEMRRTILAYVKINPGCTTKDIVSTTGIDRNVAYQLIGRMRGKTIETTNRDRPRRYRVIEGTEAPPEPRDDRLNRLIGMSEMLGAVRTGTDADAYIDEAVSRIAAELDGHVADCPFCGGRPHARLIDGLASVECGCGAVYMCKDCTGSVTETLERYSRRIE